MNNYLIGIVVVLIIIGLSVLMVSSNETFVPQDAYNHGVPTLYKNWDLETSSRPGTWPGRKDILVRFYYVPWHPLSRYFIPVWDTVKASLEDQNITFYQHNIQDGQIPIVDRLPMIIKHENGLSSIYTGPADYDTLRDWIKKPLFRRSGYLYYKPGIPCKTEGCNGFCS